ncbi:hypothetical protein HCJ57_15555 [Listeria booriae]|uniref:hypothetical protein n=1 Tax=Listeria booriae TaxID=1552123 RepID=UPI0016279E1A|nr:hypothetical protein [Listeria booriae]MBC2057942.1 hypothetical protein [Listeria booriae]
MRNTLDQIREKYIEVDRMEEPGRTNQLVNLMNVLEEEYQTHQLNPTKEFLEREEVKLYKQISMARDI